MLGNHFASVVVVVVVLSCSTNKLCSDMELCVADKMVDNVTVDCHASYEDDKKSNKSASARERITTKVPSCVSKHKFDMAQDRYCHDVDALKFSPIQRI